MVWVPEGFEYTAKSPKPGPDLEHVSALQHDISANHQGEIVTELCDVR
jgi:hypothetical protein